MKTTVVIADGLFEQARAVAQRRRVPMRELIEDGLRHVIAKEPAAQAFTFADCSYPPPAARSGGPTATRSLSWPEVRALIYEGRGGAA